MTKKIMFITIIAAMLIVMAGCSNNDIQQSQPENQTISTTKQTQPENQATNTTQQAQSKDQTANNTTNSSEKKSTQETFYGQWVITQSLAYGPVGTYTKDDIKNMIGKKLGYSEEEASYENNVHKKPVYEKSIIPKNDFEDNNHISFDTIGVKSNNIEQITINGLDSIGHIFYIRDNNTLILFDGGAYLELNRAK